MTGVWRKSSRSTTQGGECVEVAALLDGIGLRDSKRPEAGRLVLSRKRFGVLVQQIKERA